MGHRWGSNQEKRCLHAYHEVQVVADNKCMGANEIHMNEPLAAFTNRGSNLTYGLKSDRKAVWMSFHPKKRKCALRVFVGRVNVVTGKTMEEAKVVNQSPKGVQDYLVVPGQPWLDGIHIQEGIVRQFVSMPCKLSITSA